MIRETFLQYWLHYRNSTISQQVCVTYMYMSIQYMYVYMIILEGVLLIIYNKMYIYMFVYQLCKITPSHKDTTIL